MNAIPSITAFAEALTSVPAGMRTLKNFAVAMDGGRISLRRTTFFAEVPIRLDGCGYLLCAPLKMDSFDRIEPALHTVRHSSCAALTEMKVLPSELVFRNSAGETGECDLLLQRMPDGMWLDQAVLRIETQRLRSALAMLEAEFAAHGLVHGNLKPSNLIFGDDGRLYPMRCYYLRSGASAEDTAREFAEVRRYIDAFPEIAADGTTFVKPYEKRLHERFDEVFPLQYMMHRVRCGDLYGFVDENGETVIEPAFCEAGDFYENRAIVRTGSGVGVIDRKGRFVIEPQYDYMDFVAECGVYSVRSGDEFFTLDIEGRRIPEPDAEAMFEATV